MPSDPENHPGVMTRLLDADELPAGPAAVNDYDSFAAAYSAESDAGIINAYYERPAILALAGDVSGRRILDAGCGAGPAAAASPCSTTHRARRSRPVSDSGALRWTTRTSRVTVQVVVNHTEPERSSPIQDHPPCRATNVRGQYT
jgi:hypothetical protein